MSESLDADLAAAALRADGRDLTTFVNALGTWLEESVPDVTKVDRRRTRLLGPRTLVVRISCELGDETYTLVCEGNHVAARRAKSVRGIVLRTQELSVPEWVSELTKALVEQAQVAESAYDTLRELLV